MNIDDTDMHRFSLTKKNSSKKMSSKKKFLQKKFFSKIIPPKIHLSFIHFFNLLYASKIDVALWLFDKQCVSCFFSNTRRSAPLTMRADYFEIVKASVASDRKCYIIGNGLRVTAMANKAIASMYSA